MTATIANLNDLLAPTDRGTILHAAWLDPEGNYHPCPWHGAFESPICRGYDHYEHGWVRVYINNNDAPEVGFVIRERRCNDDQMLAMRLLIDNVGAQYITCSNEAGSEWHTNRAFDGRTERPLTADLAERLLATIA